MTFLRNVTGIVTGFLVFSYVIAMTTVLVWGADAKPPLPSDLDASFQERSSREIELVTAEDPSVPVTDATFEAPLPWDFDSPKLGEDRREVATDEDLALIRLAPPPDIRFAIFQQPQDDASDTSTTPPPTAPGSTAAVADSLLNAFEVELFSTRIFGGIQMLIGTPVDAASLLQTTPGISAPPRNQINTEMSLRGRRLGTPGKGSYWIPAREDLDTMLSKVDSRLVESIVAINGPYSSLYGPGLAFYDLQLVKAPRYANGYEGHSSTLVEYKSNGEQWHGRQSIWGGSSDWGFRIGYGHRVGSDYDTGGDLSMPSSYNSRMPDMVFSADLTEDHQVEFRYMRLDQTDVEFPGQMFDMDFLVTDAYDVNYEIKSDGYFDKITLESWYNRTRFSGNNLRQGKRRQIPSLDLFFPRISIPSTFGRLESFTDVDAMATGFRLAFTQECECSRFTTGVDFRYLKQRLNEVSRIAFNPPLDPNDFLEALLLQLPLFTTGENTPIPRSHSSNPGLFAETNVEISDKLSVKSGARVDWVSTNADEFVPGFESAGNPRSLETFLDGSLDQHFLLASAYLASEYQVDCHWTGSLGAGYSMQPPTMTQLYAADPFLSVLPQFAYTSARGNPNLDPEQLYQIDAGVRWDYGDVRGGLNGFYGWIHDYITFDFFEPPTGVDYGYVNTELATLSGGEFFSELDLNCWITTFATASYVEGRDHTRRSHRNPGAQVSNDPRSSERDSGGNLVVLSNSEEEPLPTMPPLEGRVGVRFHAPHQDPCWMLEISARIVDSQERVATSLGEQVTSGFTTYDARAFWRATDHLLVTIGAENFTDKLYQHYFDTHVGPFNAARGDVLWRDVFQPGANFYVGLEFTR